MKQWEYAFFRPKVLGRLWKDHPHFGEQVQLIRKDKQYPIWYVKFRNGDTWYANEKELSE